ncbi:MAG: hypothetical protein HYX75_08540 [Acidobacteria bacterium]|nr:hypothetical protein [Acidobacteriota bacterium]
MKRVLLLSALLGLPQPSMVATQGRYEDFLGSMGAGDITSKGRGRDDGILQIELKEALPPQFCDIAATRPLPCRVVVGRDLKERLAYWLVVPGSEPLRSAAESFTHVLGSPAGRFEMRVEANAIARRVPTGEAGLLVLLTFDPLDRSELKVPLHPAFEVAASKGLFTKTQNVEMALVSANYQRRYDRLLQQFTEFAEGTYVMGSRKELYAALAALSYPADPGPASGLPERYAPENFFDREQREILRSGGIAIPGTCMIHHLAGRLRLDLRNCPISQVVKTWNEGWSQYGVIHPDRIDLHEEVDLDLSMPSASEAVAGRAAFRFLLALLPQPQ